MTQNDTLTTESADNESVRVTVTTPTGIAAPLDTPPESILDYLEPMFANAYSSGTTLQYQEFELTHTTNGVWIVQHVEETTPLDIVNIHGFQTASQLHGYLKDLSAFNPRSREEWQTHRATIAMGGEQ